MKSCVLIGLHEPHLRHADFNAMRRLLGELWTMNDFYQFYPALRPDRIFNIHKNFAGHPDPMRWQGSWIGQYKRSGAARVYVCKHFEGLQREFFYPIEAVSKKFDPCFQSSSVTMMLALARLENYRHISLRGFHMLEAGEYKEQLPLLVRALEILKKEGLQIDAPMLEPWLRQLSRSSVDWTKVRPAVRPYWDDPSAEARDLPALAAERECSLKEERRSCGGL
ncbi:MAG: hypothetical protein A2X49_06740 [Lentisphaerae bacterium GWF2_52_8]|nr:MAG: hypothetical protein A2X49_06740 [Lentisphaerae bacterium GWF2_52_8]